MGGQMDRQTLVILELLLQLKTEKFAMFLFCGPTVFVYLFLLSNSYMGKAMELTQIQEV